MRLISLMLLILKTLEELLDRLNRDIALANKTLLRDHYAYGRRYVNADNGSIRKLKRTAGKIYWGTNTFNKRMI